MKALASAAALALAAFAIWRFKRRGAALPLRGARRPADGTRAVVAGRFTTNAVRAAALLLFLLEGDRASAAEPAASPVPSDGLTRIGSPGASPAPSSRATFGGSLPVLLAGEGLRRWARRADDYSLRETIKNLSAWETQRDPERRTAIAKELMASATGLPPEMRELIAGDLAGETAPPNAAASLRALDALENGGIWNASLAAWIWRRTAAPEDVAELPALYARIESHLRAVDVLTKTAAITGPVRHTPWMSKAMPPKGYQGRVEIPADFEATATKLYPETPAGTWETDAAIGFTAGAAATLHRRGEKIAVAKGDFVRLRRLDVLEGASALEHATLGKIAVPAGTRVTAWSLPSLLTKEQRASLEKDASEAVAGDAAAMKRLEALLPAAHPSIRAAIAGQPDAPGAAAVRQLLTTFDE